MIRSGATPKRSHPMVCRRWMGGGTLHRRRRDALRACWPGTLPRLVTLGDSELVPLLKAARSSGRSSGQM